jgi:hypothetical protein
LSLEGSVGQHRWRKRINEAIFHHASASRYSIGSGGASSSLTTSAVAGFDLGFLPASRPRLPSADSVTSSHTTTSTNYFQQQHYSHSHSSTPNKETAADYRLSSDSPRTSNINNDDLLMRPRSSSVESPFGFNDLMVNPKNKNNKNNTSMAPSLRLSYGL